MVELEHLGEICQEVADWTCTRQWNMVSWVQQTHKIKTFFMGDIILLFLKGIKEHTRKFKKQWFGPYKIQYCLPNNIVLFVNIDKFELNPILVNIDKLKPY
jgi:hypothetical protein